MSLYGLLRPPCTNGESTKESTNSIYRPSTTRTIKPKQVVTVVETHKTEVEDEPLVIKIDDITKRIEEKYSKYNNLQVENLTTTKYHRFGQEGFEQITMLIEENLIECFFEIAVQFTSTTGDTIRSELSLFKDLKVNCFAFTIAAFTNGKLDMHNNVPALIENVTNIKNLEDYIVKYI